MLFGPAALDTHGLEHVVAGEVISMKEKPAEAVRAKPDSSLVASCRAIAEGDADAVVSAGNTGAMLAAGLLEIRRLPGVARPAIAVPIPARDGPSVLLDCGANADARPEHLLQFGYMGAIFAEEILGIRTPCVRLLSIGEEAEKGNQLTLEAHALLAQSPLDFRGNTEGRDLLAKAADVVVTDGFTGNVALKTLEGTIRTVVDGPARRDHVVGAREGGRCPDPSRRTSPSAPARPRHVRRRVPARPARSRRDRPWELVPAGDRKCDPPGGAGCRARHHRPARRAASDQGRNSGLIAHTRCV